MSSVVPSSARLLTEELKQAYAATTFSARVPGGELRIRVGELQRALDALLEDRGLRAWAYVTAYNPGSIRTDPAVNDQAHQRLLDDLAERGLESFEGNGDPDGSEWPSEPSLLVLGIAEDEAVALGSRFGQLAIVVGTRGEPARLVAVPPVAEITSEGCHE